MHGPINISFFVFAPNWRTSCKVMEIEILIFVLKFRSQMVLYFTVNFTRVGYK